MYIVRYVKSYLLQCTRVHTHTHTHTHTSLLPIQCILTSRLKDIDLFAAGVSHTLSTRWEATERMAQQVLAGEREGREQLGGEGRGRERERKNEVVGGEEVDGGGDHRVSCMSTNACVFQRMSGVAW